MPQNGHGKRDNRMVFTCSGSNGILEGIWIRFTNCGFGSSAYLQVKRSITKMVIIINQKQINIISFIDKPEAPIQ